MVQRHLRSVRTAGAISLAVCLLVPSVSSQDIQRGRVVQSQSRWATNDYGDQRIVTDLEVDLPSGRVSAQVEGGTRDGVTLVVSDELVPEVGSLVEVTSGRSGWRVKIVEEDFSTAGRTWPSDSLWVLNTDNADGIPADTVEQESIAAAGAWTDQSDASFAMTFVGRTAQSVQALDYTNIVLFRNTPSPTNEDAVASTFCWWTGNTKTDCDIIVWDGAYTFLATTTTPCSLKVYVQDVLTHEFGHYAGLSHSTIKSATMWSAYTYCSKAMRSLAADDIAGIEFLYPPDGEPPPPPPPTATLTATARTFDSGVRSTKLVWSGLTSANVDLYRNGVKIATMTNDGSAADTVPGAGSYTYQQCAQSTAVCTNQASVTY